MMVLCGEFRVEKWKMKDSLGGQRSFGLDNEIRPHKDAEARHKHQCPLVFSSILEVVRLGDLENRRKRDTVPVH